MKATTKPIIDRSTAYAMINLLDWLYKRGVEDAYNVADNGLCREFLADTDKTGVFGFLTDNYGINWQEWVLRLSVQARRTSWSGPMATYINGAGRYGQNYLSVFYVVALVWYKMGIKDYLDEPNALDIIKFKEKSKVWWTTKGNRCIKQQDFIDHIQQQCFDLERLHTQAQEGHTPSEIRKLGCLNPTHFGMFRRCIGLAVMKR